MANILVVAPHPDDETLGCGGTLFRHKDEGDTLFWLIATAATPALGFSEEFISRRQTEIRAVAQRYGFASVFELNYPTTTLDTIPKREIIQAFSGVFSEAKPDICYLPNPGDAHSDHAACFDAAIALSKWFRTSSVQQILVYETLSETHFKPLPHAHGFVPNYYINIEAQMERKLATMRLYEGEMGVFPFPRSEEAMRAQAMVRGCEAGMHAAEAFVLVKQVR
jgi:LmbE family N-acetylglucosaminyl deacetylase